MKFEGKTVMVTGASRGIGRAIADAFLDKGSRVIGLSTSEANWSDKNYFHLVMDLSDPAVFSGVTDKLPSGFKNIDILVNNAGIKRWTELDTSKIDDWDNTMNVNLRSIYFLAQTLHATLAKSESGRIINIASQSGVAHVRSSIEYGLSKSGVIYLTKSLARALAKDGITVNAVSPGRTMTDMTGYENDPTELSKAVARIPLGRVNSTQEIAETVLFLASNEARNITGQIISIDGGEALF